MQLVELQDNIEFRGTCGRVRHSFFLCSQYVPIKLSAHEHTPGLIQIPLFSHRGIQIAVI